MNFLKRNVASQTIRVLAFDKSSGDSIVAHEANITARITLDGGTPANSNDTNPTPVDNINEPGIYEFTLTQAESNAADYLDFTAKSSAATVAVVVIGGNRFLTYADGTFDAIPSTLTTAQVGTEVDTALADYDGPTHAELTSEIAALNDFDPATETVNLSSATEQQIDDIQTELLQHLLAFAHFGTIDDATPSTTEITISGSQFVNTDDYYNGMECYVLSGAGSPRSTGIADQVTLTLTLSPALEVTPENGAIIAIMKR